MMSNNFCLFSVMNRFSLLSFMVVLFVTFPSYAQAPDSAAAAKFFRGHDGAFVLFNMNKNEYFRYNPQRCAERFLPASTYKIPNALIGLETGVIPDSNFVIKWDGKPRPFKEWERDHNLKSAIQFSVVWYFQELARRVGREKEQYWLDTLNYGNKKIDDKVDRFWLDNSLQISADEQVEFLKKLYDETLPFSRRSIKIVKDILSSERIGKAVMKFKTGTGHIADETGGKDNFIAWLVGYVESGEDVYIFAFNIDGKNFDGVSNLRNSIPKEIMKNLGIF
jgi:beta-lactamase class D